MNKDIITLTNDSEPFTLDVISPLFRDSLVYTKYILVKVVIQHIRVCEYTICSDGVVLFHPGGITENLLSNHHICIEWFEYLSSEATVTPQHVVDILNDSIQLIKLTEELINANSWIP